MRNSSTSTTAENHPAALEQLQTEEDQDVVNIVNSSVLNNTELPEFQTTDADDDDSKSDGFVDLGNTTSILTKQNPEDVTKPVNNNSNLKNYTKRNSIFFFFKNYSCGYK